MPSFSASSPAERSGRTLKPTTIASEALARSTSFVEMAPTEAWITLTFTSAVESLRIVSARTSTDPCTSAFRMRLSSFAIPCCMRANS